jgi:hypothetical protein
MDEAFGCEVEVIAWLKLMQHLLLWRDGFSQEEKRILDGRWKTRSRKHAQLMHYYASHPPSFRQLFGLPLVYETIDDVLIAIQKGCEYLVKAALSSTESAVLEGWWSSMKYKCSKPHRLFRKLLWVENEIGKIIQKWNDESKIDRTKLQALMTQHLCRNTSDVVLSFLRFT